MPEMGSKWEAARQQLERVLSSRGFSHNERLSSFLRFVVEQHLQGKDSEVKETIIALEIFGRPNHDPQQDSIVRTEASRLRARLGEYYSGQGKADPLIIELPKGGYVPVIRRVNGEPKKTTSGLEGKPSRIKFWLTKPTTAPEIRRFPLKLVAAVFVLGVAWWLLLRGESWKNPLDGARFERLTDFESTELDAAISADGRFVAFLSDRDGGFDAWVSQVGSGQFVNLTRGSLPILAHESTRSVGFSGDGAHVWLRNPIDEVSGQRSRCWLFPSIGGPGRPFLARAMLALWSPDRSRILYFEPSPGDPIFIADQNGANPRQIFIDEPGGHNHHLTWSPDGRWVYFVRGYRPNETDIWRLLSSGGKPERITTHNSRVAYPALLDDRTLLYTGTAENGSGSWLYAMDLERRVTHRASSGLEQYISVAASAGIPGQPHRVVTTLANPTGSLWTVPISGDVIEESGASRLSLPTLRAVAPRFAGKSLLYLSSKGGADGLWKYRDGVATEVWKGSDGGFIAAPAVSPDGGQITFSVRRHGRNQLYVATVDGTDLRPLSSLSVRSAASWSPDGKWIAVSAAAASEGTRVFKVPVGGGAPIRLVDHLSYDPLWSPDGAFILYFHPQQGMLYPLEAVTPEGKPYPLPELSIRSEGDGYRFTRDGRGLVMLMGHFKQQDFWLVDLTSKQRRQLTKLKPGFSVTGFDVSPDGKQILFDRVRENSDVVLIDLKR